MHNVLNSPHALPLVSRAELRALEAALNARLPPQTLVARAGECAARLAMAAAPHARRIWVACGPGDNGADGLIAACHLQRWAQAKGATLCVTRWPGSRAPSPTTQWALEQAAQAGIALQTTPPEDADLVLDALLGLGAEHQRPPRGGLFDQAQRVFQASLAVIALDGLSLLNAWGDSDLGALNSINTCANGIFLLFFLRLMPSACPGGAAHLPGAHLWLADLGAGTAAPPQNAPPPHTPAGPTSRPEIPSVPQPEPVAWLGHPELETGTPRNPQSPAHGQRRVAHKGLRGDVWIVGGQAGEAGDAAHAESTFPMAAAWPALRSAAQLSPSPPLNTATAETMAAHPPSRATTPAVAHDPVSIHRDMTGALLLAGRAALHAGAGRVTVVPLGAGPAAWTALQPELMTAHIDWSSTNFNLPIGAWVCGCGGGRSVVLALPAVLAQTPVVVLDADALNAISASPQWSEAVAQRSPQGRLTVLTPHPLEAARLLGCSTAQVQSDRVHAAQALATRFGAVCVLKGAGTIVASPTGPTVVNPTGNGLLATGGTGDVLAGMIGAYLAPEAPQWAQPLPESRLAALTRRAHQLVALAVWHHGHAADSWPDGHTLTASALAERLHARAPRAG